MTRYEIWRDNVPIERAAILLASHYRLALECDSCPMRESCDDIVADEPTSELECYEMWLDWMNEEIEEEE